jgi:arylsulfatase A-like enzyme
MKLQAALALAFAASLAPAGARAGGSLPRAERVVLVSVDTLRADHVGAYGGPVATSAIDALAREGALLSDACTPTPTTGPAHASLLTGLHPWRHGVVDNAVALDRGVPRLAAWLREGGFRTAAFVGSYVLDARFGFAEGFDVYHFEPTEEYAWRGSRRGRFSARADAVVGAAMRWITAHAGERFFVWIHLFDPHTPYRPPPEYALPRDAAVDLEGKRLPPGVRDARELADLIRAYRGEVRFVDAQLGRLVERLRMLALLDGTALVVTSDHGEGLGDHGLLEHGANLHDELVRVPLVARGPGLVPGTRLAGPAQLEDLAPTLVAWAGGTPPAGLDGVDLGPWLAGRVGRSPRAAVLGRRKGYAGEPELFYARVFPEKWIGPREDGGLRFSLDVDPRELAGRAGVDPPAALRPAFAAGAPGAAPALEGEVREALEALGYVEEQ